MIKKWFFFTVVLLAGFSFAVAGIVVESSKSRNLEAGKHNVAANTFYGDLCRLQTHLRNIVDTGEQFAPFTSDSIAPMSPGCPSCSIPCDSRLVCQQSAIHYEPCNNTSDCGGRPFYRAKHRCSRCCWPNICSCGGWSQVSLGCVYDPDCALTDICQSCGSAGNCPTAIHAFDG